VGQVGGPTPDAALHAAEDASADEVTAEDEEDDDPLVACLGDQIEDGDPDGVSGELVVVEEKKVSTVSDDDEKGGQSTDEVEEDGGVRANKWHLRRDGILPGERRCDTSAPSFPVAQFYMRILAAPGE